MSMSSEPLFRIKPKSSELKNYTFFQNLNVCSLKKVSIHFIKKIDFYSFDDSGYSLFTKCLVKTMSLSFWNSIDIIWADGLKEKGIFIVYFHALKVLIYISYKLPK